MTTRKAQAAMEFLLTYGWAILVVVAAIAALAAMGVFEGNRILPEQTIFQAPIPNIDNALILDDATGHTLPACEGTSAVQIPFMNRKGRTIRLPLAAPSISACPAGSTPFRIPTCIDADNCDQTGQFIQANNDIREGGKFKITFCCQGAGAWLSENEQFESDISFQYLDVDSGLTHTHSGTVKGVVV